MKHHPHQYLLLAAILTAPTAAKALTFQIDYTYDTMDFTGAGGTVGFFASNPMAKSCLEAAAFDLGRAITSSLGSIYNTGTPYTATVGSDTVSITHEWAFTNPTTGAEVRLNSLNLAANTIRVYAGGSFLPGNAGGIGGGAGYHYSYSINSGSGSTQANLKLAMDRATAAYNAALSRNSPVTLNQLAPLSATSGTTTITASSGVKMAPALSFIQFETDFNNDGIRDSVAQLDAKYHFNHKIATATGKTDFYSLALHELMHGIGMGGGVAWDSLVGGDSNGNGKHDWLGANVIALKGTGTDMIGGDVNNAFATNHISDAISGIRRTDLSSALITAGPGEPVMGTTISTSRMVLTDTDLAFLRDLGYTTASPIPEPSTYGIMAATALALTATLRRRRKAHAN